VRQIKCFNHLICLLRNKIYHKMQHKKLYNLHKIAYFIVALLVFKMNKILSDQFSSVRKRYFRYKINAFFRISSFCHLISLSKKYKIHHKMQREKLYNLQRKAYFNCVLLVKKNRILSDQFSKPRKKSCEEKFLFSYFIYKINCSL
jgi:hypothetical protein